MTTLYQAEWCCSRLTVYLRVLCVCRRLYILVLVSLMLFHVVPEVYNDCSVFSVVHCSGGDIQMLSGAQFPDAR